MEYHAGVGGDEEVAREAEQEIGVGAEGEEAEESCGDIDDDEDDVCIHDTAVPGRMATERENAGMDTGTGGEDMADAAVLLVPEGLEFGEEGVCAIIHLLVV